MADVFELNGGVANDWQQNQRDQYAEYRDSDRWQKLRKAVELRAKGKCEICQRRDGNQLAHLGYDRIFAERLIDLLWVCWPCHKEMDDK